MHDFLFFPLYVVTFLSLSYDGVLSLSLCAGLNWCAGPVEATLALWDVEKAPRTREAWESQPSPSGLGSLGQVRTPCLLYHSIKNAPNDYISLFRCDSWDCQHLRHPPHLRKSGRSQTTSGDAGRGWYDGDPCQARTGSSTIHYTLQRLK